MFTRTRRFRAAAARVLASCGCLLFATAPLSLAGPWSGLAAGGGERVVVEVELVDEGGLSERQTVLLDVEPSAGDDWRWWGVLVAAASLPLAGWLHARLPRFGHR